MIQIPFTEKEWTLCLPNMAVQMFLVYNINIWENQERQERYKSNLGIVYKYE